MSNRSADYATLVDQLNSEVKKIENRITSKDKCVPTALIVAIAAPFIIWAILFFAKFKFTMKSEGKKKIRNQRRIFMWTLFFTIIVWTLIYCYSRYQKGGLSMICSFR